MLSKSDTSICNLALRYAGLSTNIINLDTDDSPEGAKLRVLFPVTLESIMIEHYWSFARSNVNLQQLTGPHNDGQYTSSYATPSDCLLVRGVEVEGFAIEYTQGTSRLTGQAIILTNSEDEINLTYTSSLHNPSVRPTHFVDAIANKLAVVLSYETGSNYALTDRLIQSYNLALSKGISADSNSNPFPPDPLAEGLRVRVY